MRSCVSHFTVFGKCKLNVERHVWSGARIILRDRFMGPGTYACYTRPHEVNARISWWNYFSNAQLGYVCLYSCDATMRYHFMSAFQMFHITHTRSRGSTLQKYIYDMRSASFALKPGVRKKRN